MQNLGDLNKKLQEKVEKDREEIENIVRQEFDKLKRNLESELQNVQNTFASATATMQRQTLRQAKWSLALPAAGLASLSLIFLAGSWGMTRYWFDQVEKIARNNAEIQTQKNTLQLLQKQTRGIVLYENSKGKFLIPPRGTKFQSDWQCNGRPCLKLPD